MELTDYKNLKQIANPYIMKCVLLGDKGIGKSTMLSVYVNGHFETDIPSTIGVEFAGKNITLPDYNNHQIKLQIWDTAGQEKFKSIVISYLRDVHIAFLMFDLTDKESWNNLVEWKEKLENYSCYDDIPILVLVGTKSDLKMKRVITNEEIEKRAKEWQCKSYIISSKKDNSYNMIYRMLSVAVEDFHHLIIHKHIYGKELPSGFYADDRANTYKIHQDYKSSKWCCFQ